MRKTLRKKWRYIFFQVHLEKGKPIETIDKKTLEIGMGNKLLAFFGEQTFGNIAYKLVEYNPQTKKGIIKIDRNYKDEVLGCLALISKIQETNIHIETLLTSGTLKSGREKLNKSE